MSEPVYFFEGGDPTMAQASASAQATFMYFWRELAWEARRIIPALEVAAVKASFSEEGRVPPTDDDPSVEHMWLGQVDFDGRRIHGVLLNDPNWLSSVRSGEAVELPVEELGDWMYAQGGRVYGAFTVNLMRSQMSPKERRGHDTAWGLEFGDPARIEVVPNPHAPAPKKKAGGFLGGLMGKGGDAPPEPPPGPAPDPNAEHPMSVNMAPKLAEQLARDPSMARARDDRGWTLLHHQALAGSAATVRVLLEHGADRDAKTGHGMTARELAESLGWEKVVALLA